MLPSKEIFPMQMITPQLSPGHCVRAVARNLKSKRLKHDTSMGLSVLSDDQSVTSKLCLK